MAERERLAEKPVLVMCGTLTRHLQTVEALKGVNGCNDNHCRTVLKLARLNELCAGLLDSLSYKAFFKGKRLVWVRTCRSSIRRCQGLDVGAFLELDGS